MNINNVTQRICNHLKYLRDNDSELTLEMVERWTDENGHKVSRQTISRALNDGAKNMRQATARQLAEFIEEKTEQRVIAADLLSGNQNLSALEQHPPSPLPDDVDKNVKALLQKGDRYRNRPNWQNAIRLYTEALLLVPTATRNQPKLHQIICERIGDLYFIAAKEPEIARGFYESALSSVESPQVEIRLLFRMAQTYDGSPLMMLYMENVDRKLAQKHDSILQGWLYCLQAMQAFREADRSGALELAKKALEITLLPKDILQLSHNVLLRAIGTFRDQKLLHEYEQQLLSKDGVVKPEDWIALADGFAEAGNMQDALKYLKKALKLLKDQGQKSDQSNVYLKMGYVATIMGAIEQARGYIRQSFTFPSANRYQGNLILCKTWLHDHHTKGTRWARDLLKVVGEMLSHLQEKTPLHEQPAHINYQLLHRLGLAEQIFRKVNRIEEFQKKLDEFRECFEKKRIPAKPVWYFDEAVNFAEVKPVKIGDGWEWEPGSEDGAMREKQNGIVLETAPLRGFGQVDVPRLLHPVSGEFAIQATIHGGDQVTAAIRQCSKQALDGDIAGCAAGGGGLLLFKDQRNLLRLFAHVQAPGEVLCELRSEGVSCILGRGFIGYEPLRLRVEREGSMVRAYAGGSGGSWYLCGEVDLPWDQVQVGMYGEAVIDLYAITKRAEARFWDVGLEGVGGKVQNE